MKLHAVVPLYPPHSLVGAWLTTHEFLRHMAQQGHSVSVTAYRCAAPPTWHEGVEVLTKFYGFSRPDVVIGHAGDDGSAVATAERFDVPLVMMVHGGDVSELPARLTGSSLTVFNSHNLSHAAQWDGESIVCHPPIDLGAYRREPGECVTLVNLSLEKGGALFWELAQRMGDVRFIGVQGDYGRQVLRGGLPNVHLLRTTARIADEVYARTRVLLVPSAAETFGRVAVEAGASGIPAVSTPTPGVLEAMNTAAWYCEPGDVDSWEHAVRQLLKPNVWRRRSAAVSRRLADWDSEASLRRFAEAVEEVARCKSLS